MASKDSKLNTLVKQILGISRKNRTGTLSLTSADGQEKRVVFVQGYVADIDTGREDTALEAALLRTAAFSDRDFRKAKKLQAKKDVTLASALLEMKIVPEETIVESSQQQVLDGATITLSEEECYAVFAPVDMCYDCRMPAGCYGGNLCGNGYESTACGACAPGYWERWQKCQGQGLK